jgi:hypothetical protein
MIGRARRCLEVRRRRRVEMGAFFSMKKKNGGKIDFASHFFSQLLTPSFLLLPQTPSSSNHGHARRDRLLHVAVWRRRLPPLVRVNWKMGQRGQSARERGRGGESAYESRQAKRAECRSTLEEKRPSVLALICRLSISFSAESMEHIVFARIPRRNDFKICHSRAK